MTNVAVHAPRGSLVETAIEAVRDFIKANDLKVGDTLPSEGNFAAQLGVSRPVMREAFHALAALKILDIGNGRCAKVGAIDGSVMASSIGHAVSTAQVSLADVWEVRRTLELRTAELATLNRTDQQADTILTAARLIAVSDTAATMTIADTAFHKEIARASGNDLFYQIVCSFEDMMKIAVPRAWEGRTTEAEKMETIALHSEVAQAIAERDPVKATAAMDAHFARSIGDLFHKAART